MNLFRNVAGVVLLVVGVNLSAGYDGMWRLIGGACLGAFAGLVSSR